ncbi:hypothetical protein LIER_38560 [Lithospermum erythrorhizon]|uniref:Integrase catalytic domain-containing protein n=1 Tax=Lithospermum erythrorhizon TaxID=34254 RepID=A0AAV3Q685_LITER
MRQRRWLELMKDYDLTINYYLGKANVVANALSKKSTGNLASLITSQRQILLDLESLHILIYPNESCGQEANLKVNMKNDIAKFFSQCLVCQQVKPEHKSPEGKLLSLAIPERQWEHITMDFVVGLPRTPRGDSICLIVDRLTKSAHFLPYKIRTSVPTLAKIYMKEIVRLHGVPASTVSDRDPRFVSHFCKILHKHWGPNLHVVLIVTLRLMDKVKELFRHWRIC